jgi:hypothetical protein
MNQDQQHPPMNGNDDLAKTLNEGLQFEETPMPGVAPAAPAGNLAVPAVPAPAPSLSPVEDEDDMKMPSMDPAAGDPDNEPFVPPTLSATPPADEPKEEKPAPKVEHTHAKGGHVKAGKESDAPASAAAPSAGDSELDGLKASALEELRPLVGKLNLPAEERFDTLLLIIRSTDDQGLLAQAHDAAKEIADDSRRAQALLDVIKEIDYFSSKR